LRLILSRATFRAELGLGGVRPGRSGCAATVAVAWDEQRGHGGDNARDEQEFDLGGVADARGRPPGLILDRKLRRRRAARRNSNSVRFRNI
jgi:hypothetical protein